MRPRIKKSTVVETKVEFCYSTVVTRANNSSSDVMKAELTRYNQRVYHQQKTQGVVKCVEFSFFGQRVQKGLDWIEKLEAAGFEYTIIEKKGYSGESSKSWWEYHWDFSVSLYGSVRQFVAQESSGQGSRRIRKLLTDLCYDTL